MQRHPPALRSLRRALTGQLGICFAVGMEAASSHEGEGEEEEFEQEGTAPGGGQEARHADRSEWLQKGTEDRLTKNGKQTYAKYIRCIEVRHTLSLRRAWSCAVTHCLMASYGDGINAQDSCQAFFSRCVTCCPVSQECCEELGVPATLTHDTITDVAKRWQEGNVPGCGPAYDVSPVLTMSRLRLALSARVCSCPIIRVLLFYRFRIF